MLAATYLAPGRIEAVDVPAPRSGIGQAVVKVRACGVCGSDLSIISGKHPRARPPLVIGHEFAGEIVALPAGSPESRACTFRVGDRVTLFPLLTCGECFACRNGFSHVCSSLRLVGFDRDGGMAEYVRVPVGGLVKIPDAVDWQSAALVEPLAVCVHAFRRVPVTPRDRVAVLGAGPIGLLMAITLRSEGVHDVVITDVNPFRLRQAEGLGFATVNPAANDLPEFVRQRTGGDGVDIVFEAAGAQATADQMCQIVRPRATIVNVSVFKTSPVVDMRAINFLELSIVGSRVYGRDDYDRAIEIARTDEPRRVITHRFPLEKVSEAFALLFNGGDVNKVILLPGGAA